jgi:adenylate cyclase
MKLLLFFSLLTVAIHVKSQNEKLAAFGIKLQQNPHTAFVTNVSETGIVVFMFYGNDTTDRRIFVVHNVSKAAFHNLMEHNQSQLLSEAREVYENYLVKEKDLLFRFTNTRVFQFYYILENEANSLKKKL